VGRRRSEIAPQAKKPRSVLPVPPRSGSCHLLVWRRELARDVRGGEGEGEHEADLHAEGGEPQRELEALWGVERRATGNNTVRPVATCSMIWAMQLHRRAAREGAKDGPTAHRARNRRHDGARSLFGRRAEHEPRLASDQRGNPGGGARRLGRLPASGRDRYVHAGDGASTPRYLLSRHFGRRDLGTGVRGWASCDHKPTCEATLGVVEDAGFEGSRGLKFHVGRPSLDRGSPGRGRKARVGWRAVDGSPIYQCPCPAGAPAYGHDPEVAVQRALRCASHGEPTPARVGSVLADRHTR
jgi:hypothetical protein